MSTGSPPEGATVPGFAGDGLEHVANCLFCHTAAHTRAHEGVKDLFFDADPGAFTYLRCDNCRSLWLETRPAGERLARAYANYYTHAAPMLVKRPGGLRGIRWSSYVRSRLSSSSNVVDDVLAGLTRLAGLNNRYIEEQYRFAPKAPAAVLDYGCGSGQYLLMMQPLGHNLQGVEYDAHLLKELAQRGIEVTDVTNLEDDRWAATFDHITLSHVIEHVPDPLALLSRLRGWLKPGGTLFIEAPNAEATGLAIFGNYWRGLEAPRHLSLPSGAAMRAALERAGFAIEMQHINSTARRWVWELSLGAVPQTEAAGYQAAMTAAPAETEANAEYLTFVARRPN